MDIAKAHKSNESIGGARYPDFGPKTKKVDGLKCSSVGYVRSRADISISTQRSDIPSGGPISRRGVLRLQGSQESNRQVASKCCIGNKMGDLVSTMEKSAMIAVLWTFLRAKY